MSTPRQLDVDAAILHYSLNSLQITDNDEGPIYNDTGKVSCPTATINYTKSNWVCLPYWILVG